MASFILAIANCNNLEFADARKSADEPEIEFIRQFGTSSNDIANDVFADSSRGVYVVGTTGGTFPGQTDEGNIDAFIRKYNADGDEEWTRQFGTSEGATANGVSADSSGGVYVVGFTNGELPGQTDEGIRDAFIRKYNADGDEEWTRQFGTSGIDDASGVSADSSGGGMLLAPWIAEILFQQEKKQMPISASTILRGVRSGRGSLGHQALI